MIRNPIRPPRLRPGDVVRVIAPSGPLFTDAFAAGAAVLSARYQVRHDPATLFARDGFLAGPDDQRLASLIDAVRDPEARAVFLGRGGYGLLRIANRIDSHLLRDHAKPIVGCSDGTVLLALAARAGVAAIHGPVVTQLGRLPDADRSALFSLLESGEPGPLLVGLETLCAGSAQGPLLGGNLEVFSRLLGTPYLPDLDGAILFFEEVGERPYRIDRLLTHLELAGVFTAVAGVVVGDSRRLRGAARLTRALTLGHRGRARASRPPEHPRGAGRALRSRRTQSAPALRRSRQPRRAGRDPGRARRGGWLGGWCQTAPVAWRAAGPARFVARRLNTSSIRPPRASRPGLLASPELAVRHLTPAS